MLPIYGLVATIIIILVLSIGPKPPYLSFLFMPDRLISFFYRRILGHRLDFCSLADAQTDVDCEVRGLRWPRPQYANLSHMSRQIMGTGDDLHQLPDMKGGGILIGHPKYLPGIWTPRSLYKMKLNPDYLRVRQGPFLSKLERGSGPSLRADGSRAAYQSGCARMGRPGQQWHFRGHGSSRSERSVQPYTCTGAPILAGRRVSRCDRENARLRSSSAIGLAAS